MTRGRLPTPTAVLKLQGTYRPCRRRNEPPARPGAPRAPKWLNAAARKEWHRLVPRLLERGLLEVVDRSTLVAYCTAFGELADAEQRLAEEGSTVITARGGLQLSPQVRRATMARQQLIRAAAEFGLSPSARCRVKASTARAMDTSRAAACQGFFGT